MHFNLKHVMLGGVATAFLALSGVALAPGAAKAGPLMATPAHEVALGSMTEAVQYRQRARARTVTRTRVVRARPVAQQRRVVRVRHGARTRVVYARPAPRRVVRYHHGYHHGAIVPAAVLGVMGAALTAGFAASHHHYYCDPYDIYWGGYCPVHYGGGYQPAYWGGGYYPAYWGGHYPRQRIVYHHRTRPVRHVHWHGGYRPPRVVRGGHQWVGHPGRGWGGQPPRGGQRWVNHPGRGWGAGGTPPGRPFVSGGGVPRGQAIGHGGGMRSVGMGQGRGRSR